MNKKYGVEAKRKGARENERERERVVMIPWLGNRRAEICQLNKLC